jgi:FixJ family two-component response regulator
MVNSGDTAFVLISAALVLFMTLTPGANSLNLSLKTGETHRGNIMRKLGLHSIADLVLYAIRNHIIEA